MTDLNELFEQILQSEQKFKARVDEIKLAGLEAEKCQVSIHQIKEDIQSKRGQLAIKRNKLADQEVEVQVLRIRKEILANKKDKLYEEKHVSSQKALEAENKYEADHANFIKELTQFSRYYDILGSGVKNRHTELKKEKSLLQDEILLLEAELVEIKCQEEEVNTIQSELTEIENKLLTATKELTELSKTEDNVQKEISSLEQERDQPLSQDPEFARLQKQLDLCKQSTREETCQQLSKELEELQRQFYHKQMSQQLVEKKADTQHATAGSSRTSGHYNPYTQRYVPAPNPPTSVTDSKAQSKVNNPDNSGDTGDSMAEWGMDVNEEDLVFSDDDFLESGTEIPPKASATKHLPTSIFHSTTKPPAVSSGSSEFQPSNTIYGQSSTPHPSTLSRSPTLTAGRIQGGSIVKQARPANSVPPKRAKKVRFRY